MNKLNISLITYYLKCVLSIVQELCEMDKPRISDLQDWINRARDILWKKVVENTWELENPKDEDI